MSQLIYGTVFWCFFLVSERSFIGNNVDNIIHLEFAEDNIFKLCCFYPFTDKIWELLAISLEFGYLFDPLSVVHQSFHP